MDSGMGCCINGRRCVVLFFVFLFGDVLVAGLSIAQATEEEGQKGHGHPLGKDHFQPATKLPVVYSSEENTSPYNRYSGDSFPGRDGVLSYRKHQRSFNYATDSEFVEPPLEGSIIRDYGTDIFITDYGTEALSKPAPSEFYDVLGMVSPYETDESFDVDSVDPPMMSYAPPGWDYGSPPPPPSGYYIERDWNTNEPPRRRRPSPHKRSHGPSSSVRDLEGKNPSRAQQPAPTEADGMLALLHSLPKRRPKAGNDPRLRRSWNYYASVRLRTPHSTED